MIDLSNTKRVKNSKHWYTEINQLYHPTGFLGQESQNLVYTFGNLNTTKFVPILLKEWFYLIAKGGCIIIDYKPNKLCDWQKLEENMWRLWKDKYEIIYHGPVSGEELNHLDEEKLQKFISDYENYYKNNLDGKTLLPKPLPTETEPKTKEEHIRFICKKKISTRIEGDSINNWSFGIITNGTREAWLENMIRSIRQQKIPHYEIIVCGRYFDRKEPDFRYIPFNKRDDKGWITKKKNIIARVAKFQNLCIMHDRIFLGEKWYKGMKKWGNCFEVLAVPQLSIETKERFGDWVCNKDFDAKKANNFLPLKEGCLEYKDWDKDVPGYAAVIIIKKFIFLENGFSETLYWGKQYDDLLLHQDIYSKGYILRMNPDAITCSKTKSVVDFRWYYEFNSLKLGKLKGVNSFVYLGFLLFHLLGLKKNSKVLKPFKSFIKKRYNIKTHQNKE